MNRYAILFVIFSLMSQALGESHLPNKAKKSFLQGVDRLMEQKMEIFNAETLPALKPIKDVQITADLETRYSTHQLEGVAQQSVFS